MDAARLPSRVLIDTPVLIRALGDRPDEAHSTDCKDFVEAMIKNERVVLVAAPSIAEMIRGMSVPAPPKTSGLVVVAFDDVAAVVLGMQFPAKTLKETASSAGIPLPYLKYDAMIAACAIRHKAQYLISLDQRLPAQVPASLKVAAPGAFRHKQLPLIPSAPTEPRTSKKKS
jgi:predicted nucleic acid-binding protein